MTDEPGRFDAGQRGDTATHSAAEQLLAMQHQEADAAVLRSVEQAREWITAFQETFAEEELLPQELEALVAVTSAPDAPGAFKILRERVESGAYTWADIYNHPERFGDVGFDLVTAVLAWTSSQLDRWNAEALAEGERIAEAAGRPMPEPPRRPDDRPDT